ncbi:MAG: hypothetical protein WC643_00070 [Parcubacteria group bacterium]|jgi:hypothetical protein
MKKISIIICILSLGLFFAANTANAAPDTPRLEVVSNKPLFNVSDAAPGKAYPSPVTIRNHGDNEENFQFEVTINADPSILADHLFFKINKVETLDPVAGESCAYDCDGNVTMSSLNGREIFVNHIPPHSTNYFLFYLVFDPESGTGLMGETMNFDMILGYEDQDGSQEDGANDSNNNNITISTNANPGFFQSVQSFIGNVSGAEISGEQVVGGENQDNPIARDGIVKGEEASNCQGWPKWVWVLMLIAYFAAFLWRTFDKIKQQIEKRDIRRKWQAALAIVAFLIWYFFDKCREFWWFVILAMIGGAVIYLLYLYLFRKNIREERAKVESGSGQNAPKDPTNQIPPAV